MSTYKLTPMLFNLTDRPFGFYGDTMVSNGGYSHKVAKLMGTSDLTADRLHQRVKKLVKMTLRFSDLTCDCCYTVRGVMLDSQSPLAKPLAKRLAKYKLEVVLV